MVLTYLNYRPCYTNIIPIIFVTSSLNKSRSFLFVYMYLFSILMMNAKKFEEKKLMSITLLFLWCILFYNFNFVKLCSFSLKLIS